MDNSVMFKISYGLYVLTATDGDRYNGCIVNTLQQVTSDPNRVSVTVNKGNYTHDLIKDSGRFNVTMLSEKVSFDTFRHFGFQSGRDTDKFAPSYGIENYRIAENDLPYITKGSSAYLSGKVIQEVDLGSHTMFIADVTGGEMLSEDEPLTYSYYHKHVKEAPADKGVKKGWVCKICGYVYEGDELPEDFVCPVCKHGAADFERL